MKGRFGVWYLRLCQWLARHRLWRPGKIMYIGGSDVLPAPLSREEEGELIARLAEGDQAASSTLIERPRTSSWPPMPPGASRMKS